MTVRNEKSVKRECDFAEIRKSRNSHIRAALVSTNSITQGEQVTAIWKTLIEQYGIRIDFAYRTFRWDSEAMLKAHVHCVIVGFSSQYNTDDRPCVIYDGKNAIHADNISPYLLNAPTIFIDKRKSPLVNVPQMSKGSQPTDGGNLILSAAEREEIIKNSPKVAKYIRPFVGADEFIKGKKRYCLWLAGASPADLAKSTEVARRIQAVHECRKESPKYKNDITNIAADYETIFIGGPIWWGQPPMIIRTFFEAHPELDGKTIIPFGTHGGSGVGSYKTVIQEYFPKATILESLGISGSSIRNAFFQSVSIYVKPVKGFPYSVFILHLEAMLSVVGHFFG